MQRSLLILLATLSLLLTGCASPKSAAEQPYTDAQVKQFALEMLSRSGLPYEEYEKVRSALLAPKHRMSNAISDSQAMPRVIPEA